MAEVSGHNAAYIMREMPLAVGLQFRTIYWQKNGVEVVTITDLASTRLSTIIK